MIDVQDREKKLNHSFMREHFKKIFRGFFFGVTGKNLRVAWLIPLFFSSSLVYAGTPPVLSINAPAATAARTTSFTYDASGLLSAVIVEPDNTQLTLETFYSYDAWGNRTGINVSSPAGGNAAIAPTGSSHTFDARGQFPVMQKNALGHASSSAFDMRYGMPISVSDANNLAVQIQYDSLGRKILEINPDGNRKKWEYLYCSGIDGGNETCSGYARYVIKITPLAADGITLNGAWSKTYFDGLDREVRSETVGFDGTRTIAASTEYDSRGNISRASRPYYAGATIQWTSNAYDELNRLSARTAPDNSISYYSYDGFITAFINALGQVTAKVLDAKGQLALSYDNDNQAVAYQYDAFGNLWLTTDPKGNMSFMSYDIRGRKTQMYDGDNGSTIYSHDALSRVVQQTDAKGQGTAFTYDLLGRMNKRSEEDLTSGWTYDTCANGIGKLCATMADNGYREVQDYDGLGRASANSTTIDASYASSRTFDVNGRLATQAYPAGLVLAYVYTSQGYLKEVRNNATNALLWSAGAMDAEGHLLEQTYGNQIVTQSAYNAATGRIQNSYAGAGNGVLILGYDFDSIGNLSSRSDANQNLSETFLYDRLNRVVGSSLTSAGAGVVAQTYTYDAIGNITGRSGVGQYSYLPGQQPHAVASIAWEGGGVRSYAYDANGNLRREMQSDAAGADIPSKSRSGTYTSFNMPLTLATAATSTTFLYGPAHQRVKELSPGLTTVYLQPDNSGGLFYEKDIHSNGTTEHRQFITVNGAVVAVVKNIAGNVSVQYFHRDYLGSTIAVSDESGALIERFSYEAYGKRRFSSGALDGQNGIAGVNTKRGFTNHEQLDALGLIHMNGRVYDPVVGRFMTADPGVPYPDNLQSYNRYSYCRNNPLGAVDPSGFVDRDQGDSAGAGPRTGDAIALYESGAFSSNPVNHFLSAGAQFKKVITGKNSAWVADVESANTTTSGESEQAKQRTLLADKAAGVLVGSSLGATAGVALSGGCDIATVGACAPANPAIVATTATIGGVIGAEIVPPFMASSRELAKNIATATGDIKKQFEASHHIVAENDPRAKGSQSILTNAGMGIDSAFNGMNMSAQYHARLHTNAYHASVERALTGASSYAEVAARLSVIRVQINLGKFPF